MLRLFFRCSVFLAGAGLAVALYQNCGPGFSVQQLNESEIASNSIQSATCFFNGQTIVAGGSVTAYKFPNAPSEQQCVSETRTCSGGALNGSFTNASCIATAPGNCALGTQEIVNGSTALGYSTQQVVAGQTCATVSATATCRNGSLVPNIYPTCTVSTSTSCPFNSRYVPEGVTITAYLSSTVPYGGLCSSEPRTCQNGTLSGSFTAETCTPAPASSCYMGSTKVADGGSVQVFTKSVVPFGETCTSAQQSVTCRNGVFVFADGSLATNKFSTTCITSPTTTCQFAGKTLQPGETISGYQHSTAPVGQTCNLIKATCEAGVMVGLPISGYNGTLSTLTSLAPTCEVGGCNFGGVTVPNKKTVAAYTTSLVGFSQTCASAQTTLTCVDGFMTDSTGSYTKTYFPTCASATSSSCSFTNWADTLGMVKLDSGQTLTGYTSSSVLENSSCASVQKTISCNDGILSLNGAPNASALNGVFYFYNTCNVGACKIGSQMIMDGASVSAYSAAYVGFGKTCSSIQATLTCKNTKLYNGTLEAQNYSTTCSSATKADCTVSDGTANATPVNIPNGQSLMGYGTYSAMSCDAYKVKLTCSDGLITVNDQTPTPFYNHYYPSCKPMQ